MDTKIEYCFVTLRPSFIWYHGPSFICTLNFYHYCSYLYERTCLVNSWIHLDIARICGTCGLENLTLVEHTVKLTNFIWFHRITSTKTNQNVVLKQHLHKGNLSASNVNLPFANSKWLNLILVKLEFIQLWGSGSYIERFYKNLFSFFHPFSFHTAIIHGTEKLQKDNNELDFMTN